MPDESTIEWYGVRSVYHFGKKKNGTNLFEERICLFSGKDSADALEKAYREAVIYAKDGDMKRFPELVSYLQDGEILIDGYEVFSEIFEYNGNLETFYYERYTKYDYTPDDPIVY